MDRLTLCRIGSALYGPAPGWHEPLAIDLAVAKRTMQRWAAGTREIPDIQGELVALVHERSRELARLVEDLSEG